jgi:hypothetical protein
LLFPFLGYVAFNVNENRDYTKRCTGIAKATDKQQHQYKHFQARPEAVPSATKLSPQKITSAPTAQLTSEAKNCRGNPISLKLG